MGGMPHGWCAGPDTGLYVKRYNPFACLTDIAGNDERCRHVQPLDHLIADIRKDDLPRFAFISPDLCMDMHDCSISTGDHYLSHLIPRILPALGADGVLFLTFDEGVSDTGCCRYAQGGHVATVVAGPAVVKAGPRSVPYDLCSILRTIEEAWGLSLLRKAGCPCTEPMTAFF